MKTPTLSAVQILVASLAAIAVIPFTGTAASPDGPVPADQAEADELVSMWPVFYPEADELVEQLITSLPTTPVRLQGELRRKGAGGDFQPVARVDVSFHPGQQRGAATYELQDLFGSPLERLEVIGIGESATSVTYFAGTTMESTPFPGWSAAVCQTDLTWQDLTLSFLSWGNGTTLGRDRVRGRPCYIVELPAPMSGGVAKVHVWIDAKLGMLLKVDSISATDEVIRSLSVKKFRKIDDIWMVSDIGVTSFPAKSKTSLLIYQVSAEMPPDSGTGPALIGEEEPL